MNEMYTAKRIKGLPHYMPVHLTAIRRRLERTDGDLPFHPPPQRPAIDCMFAAIRVLA